jgi:hypothetical protein
MNPDDLEGKAAKEAIRNYMLLLAPAEWPPPLLDSMTLRAWAGMLYDGLAYGNWPWINFCGDV